MNKIPIYDDYRYWMAGIAILLVVICFGGGKSKSAPVPPLKYVESIEKPIAEKFVEKVVEKPIPLSTNSFNGNGNFTLNLKVDISNSLTIQGVRESSLKTEVVKEKTIQDVPVKNAECERRRQQHEQIVAKWKAK